MGHRCILHQRGLVLFIIILLILGGIGQCLLLKGFLTRHFTQHRVGLGLRFLLSLFIELFFLRIRRILRVIRRFRGKLEHARSQNVVGILIFLILCFQLLVCIVAGQLVAFLLNELAGERFELHRLAQNLFIHTAAIIQAQVSIERIIAAGCLLADALDSLVNFLLLILAQRNIRCFCLFAKRDILLQKLIGFIPEVIRPHIVVALALGILTVILLLAGNGAVIHHARNAADTILRILLRLAGIVGVDLLVVVCILRLVDFCVSNRHHSRHPLWNAHKIEEPTDCKYHGNRRDHNRNRLDELLLHGDALGRLLFALLGDLRLPRLSLLAI